MTDDILWSPSADRAGQTAMAAFLRQSGQADYDALYRWSVTDIAAFWDQIWQFCELVGDRGDGPAVAHPNRMPQAGFFPSARLNYAENLLRRRDDGDAIVFRAETGAVRRLSAAGLYNSVSCVAQALEAAGVGIGDRVAGYLPNVPEAVIAMLAATSLGATWSSASPDFGVQGVLDRFGQIEPTVLFAADGYFYNGKAFDCLDKVGEILASLPSVRRAVIVPYAGSSRPLPDKAVRLAEFVTAFPARDISFRRLPFDHPLAILYSSGTTGAPKCIVHGAGGTLLTHLKELRLHTDVGPGDRAFYFTTLGWMMWNWIVSSLATGATLMLFDGSPFHPGPEALWEYAEAERITLFGTSAKYLDAVAKSGLKPGERFDLSSIRTITSTGSPLLPESFDFVYRDVKSDVLLASISGGTDIVGCFVLGNPMLPVRRGEIQCRGLGFAVEVHDEDGKPVTGQKGELVCVKPFPSMPVMFWNDPSNARYHAAYFERFPGIWCHGDYVELTKNGGLIIYGRSDAVLNPGGVRIGTAEIYRQVEQLPEVLESLVIGQDWEGDVRVILFVRLRDGVTLDDDLKKRLSKRIKDNASPRHVPAKIIQVTDIPRTKSGKITELAVRDVVHGRAIKNVEALANPEALALFKDLPELGV